MLSPSERLELEQLASPDNPDETLQLRAQIILSWANGATGEQSAAALSTSRRTVSKWRGRFREAGVEGLVDAPRPGAPRTIDERKIAELLRLQNSPPPQGRSRWTTRLLAEHTGLSQSTVVRISKK
jgi:transposase